MTKSINLVLWSLIFSVAAWPDAVTNTICSATLGDVTTMQTNPSSCSVAIISPIGEFLTGASASISNTQTLPVLGSPSAPVSSSFTLSTSTGGPVITANSAEASGTNNILLRTTGPVRPGEIAFSESIGLDGVFSTLSATISVSSLHTTCLEDAGFPPFCSGNFGPMMGNGTGTVPFTLGQTFLFTESALQNAMNGNDIPHFGNGNVNFSFTLLEADGRTPVQMFAVPEPATHFLLAASLLCLLFIAKQRRAPESP